MADLDPDALKRYMLGPLEAAEREAERDAEIARLRGENKRLGKLLIKEQDEYQLLHDELDRQIQIGLSVSNELEASTDENNALLAELDRAREENKTLSNNLAICEFDLNGLQGELDRAREDAARLDWLESVFEFWCVAEMDETYELMVTYTDNERGKFKEETIRAAIDKARG